MRWCESQSGTASSAACSGSTDCLRDGVVHRCASGDAWVNHRNVCRWFRHRFEKPVACGPRDLGDGRSVACCRLPLPPVTAVWRSGPIRRDGPTGRAVMTRCAPTRGLPIARSSMPWNRPCMTGGPPGGWGWFIIRTALARSEHSPWRAVGASGHRAVSRMPGRQLHNALAETINHSGACAAHWGHGRPHIFNHRHRPWRSFEAVE